MDFFKKYFSIFPQGCMNQTIYNGLSVLSLLSVLAFTYVILSVNMKTSKNKCLNYIASKKYEFILYLVLSFILSFLFGTFVFNIYCRGGNSFIENHSVISGILAWILVYIGSNIISYAIVLMLLGDLINESKKYCDDTQ